MMSIALVTTFQILKTYSYGAGFYTYWKTCITYTLYKYFKDNSLKDQMELRINSEDDLAGEFSTSKDDTVSHVSATLLLERIKQILLDPTYGFKMLDVEMYLLEVEKGYSYKDIAEIYGIKYHTVRLKSEKTKAKLKNILFNSKE